MQIDARLIDHDKVLKAINNLTDIDKNKAIKSGLRDATRLILKAGKSNYKSRRIRNNEVYVTTGNLEKSFRNLIKRKKLGAIAGFSRLGMHSHLIDKGTTERKTKKGYNRGKINGNSFWTDAFNQNINSAIDTLYFGIERALEKIIFNK